MELISKKKSKCVYKTTDEIWGMVVQVKISQECESVHGALDYLIRLGYKSWKDGKGKQI